MRTARTVHLAAALSGFALLFGSTDASVFEIVAVVVAIASSFLLIYKKLYAYIPFSTQNYILLSFAVLVSFQVFLIPETDKVFALITLYLIGVYGLIQFWLGKESGVGNALIYGYLAGAVGSAFLGIFAYIDVLTGDSLRIFWENDYRISVLFDDPVVYGAFLVPAVLILSVKALLSTSRGEYAMYTLLTLLVFGNMILTVSRGAWLNLIVAGIVFLFLYKEIWKKPVIIKLSGLLSTSLLLAIMLMFVIPIGDESYFAATLTYRYQSSDEARVGNLQSAPDRLTNRSPAAIVFGGGSGTYEQTTEEGFSAHNTYLRVLYEQGIVGIFLYLALIFFVVKNVLTRRGERPLTSALVIAFIMGILVQGLFVDTLHWRHFWIVMAFAL